jgi:hypothetical protein
MTQSISAPRPIWTCKIGILGEANLPPAADWPMRQAVEAAFQRVVGLDADFAFSGWSGELDEVELAVVENRLPSEQHYRDTLLRDAAPDLLEALAMYVALCGNTAAYVDREGVQAAYAKAVAAIDKATGAA